MNEKTKEFLETVAGIILVFTIIIPVIPLGAYAAYHNLHTRCSQQPIPFKSVTQNDPSAPSDGAIQTPGVNGEAYVCTKGDKQISKTIQKQPVTEVTVYGEDQQPDYPDPPDPRDDSQEAAPSYQQYDSDDSDSAPSYSAPTQTQCVTTCVDGSCSSSTGRGTCSWHGGEAY